MVNFGPLAAEIVSLVWGTPGNFNGFRVLAALLHGTLPGEPKKIPATTFVDITSMHGNFCTKFYTIVKRSNVSFITKFY